MIKSGQQTSLWIIALAIIAIAAMIVSNPYRAHPKLGYAGKSLAHTVDIDMPPDSVFRYLGNSDNASHWSVFVDHIIPLNADSIPDGSVGSRRRCFCKADGKSGKRWDETISEVVPGKKRQLLLYDFVGFPFSSDHLATEQIYEDLGSGKCRLTFTVFFKDAQPALMESAEMYLSAFYMESIFTRNMANIKWLVETGK
jgi:uncharacterized protein YndB with AHSA1/START domain